MLSLNIHLCITLTALVLLLFEEEGGGLAIVIFALVAAVFEVALWARREIRAGTLNWCHPVPVFTLGYCIIYYQLPFCYLAGFDLSYYSNYVIFAPQKISYCVLLGVLGLSAFYCGEHIITLKRRNRQQRLGCCRVWHDPATVRSLNSAVLVLTVLFFLFYLKSIGLDAYLGFSYGLGKVNAAAFSTHLGFLYTIFLYLAILMDMSRVIQARPLTFATYLRAWDKRVLLVTVFTIVPYVLSGDRGSYLQPIALLVVPYFILIHKLKLVPAIAVATLLAFVLVVIGDTRGRDSASWGEALSGRVESITNPAQWPTMELANSFGTFNIATSYFPEKYEYKNGVKALYSIAALIPFSSFFSDISSKNRESDYIFSSSLFFTNILTQGTFSSGSGTSALADVYMDFGAPGIPVFLFIWGAFIAWICSNTFSAFSPLFVFWYSYYSYVCIYVNRSTFFTGFNHVIWVFLLFYLIRLVYLDRYSKSAPPGAV